MNASLKQNVLANGLGQGWRTVMSFAFIPLYVRYLGIEAYGLIGIFALVQAWLVLLDMGLRPALGREMARFKGGAHSPQSIRNLLRTVEFAGIGIAAVIALSIWAASRWLAADWLRADKLPVAVVARAFTVMGAVTALRFIEDIYVSCLAGLELQVTQNAVTSLMATVRGLGAAAILAWVSPTIEAFFIWQGTISLVTVGLFAGTVYHALPQAPRRAHPSVASLREIRRFAAGMVIITCLALLLTQVDKVLLSRLLTLKAYGYYVLAGVVANGLSALSAPVTAAFYPRFTALATLDNQAALRVAYHQGSQLVAVLLGSAAAVLIVFRNQAVLLWTRDPALARQVAPLMAVLTLGTLLNGLVSIPYQLMLAHGWTALTIRINFIAVSILVPAIIWTVPHFGSMGAAWIWVILNASYVAFTVSLMHTRILPGERWRWYGEDVALPLLVATATAFLFRQLIPSSLGVPAQIVALGLASALVLLATAISAPAVRQQLIRYSPTTLKVMIARQPSVDSVGGS